jgi:hypothetical protein
MPYDLSARSAMLKTLTLNRFRGFESYSLSDFTRVNLVVGRNNSGKTSVLEAVELLVTYGHLSVFYGAARRRGETARLYQRGYGPIISSVFFGHQCEPGSFFELSSEDGRRNLRATIVSLDEVGDVNWLRRPSYAEDSPEPMFGMSIVSDDKNKDKTFPIAEDGSIMDYRTVSRNSEFPDTPVHFLALESFASNAMGKAWNQILTEGREDEIVGDMQLLLPDIDSIHFLTSERPSGTGILVGRRAMGRRIPIGSYGDGMRRLLAFRLALVGAASGFLLIDEVDVGLHWTVMEDVWRLLVEVAKRSRTQIFATTHSYDCIRGLGQLLRSQPDLTEEVSLHKIDHSLVRAVSLHGDQIPIAIEQEIEVR